MTDKNLVCRECGVEFLFTEGEQEFYQKRGLLNEPSRCPECRSARRRAPQLRGGLPPHVLGDLCKLRQRGRGAFPAASGQAGVLQRLLRIGEGCRVTSSAADVRLHSAPLNSYRPDFPVTLASRMLRIPCASSRLFNSGPGSVYSRVRLCYNPAR